MTRSTLLFDRVVCGLVGSILVAFGVGLGLWQSGKLGAVSSPTSLNELSRLENESWWPWAVSIGGAVLVLLGLRWMLAHVRRNSIGKLSLTGSSKDFQLVADADAVVDAAEEILAQTNGVRSVKGSAVRDRGQRVLKLDVKMEPTGDLAVIGAACDEVAADIRTALDRNDVFCRFDVSVASRGRALPRVD